MCMIATSAVEVTKPERCYVIKTVINQNIYSLFMSMNWKIGKKHEIDEYRRLETDLFPCVLKGGVFHVFKTKKNAERLYEILDNENPGAYRGCKVYRAEGSGLRYDGYLKDVCTGSDGLLGRCYTELKLVSEVRVNKGRKNESKDI